jgi:hypothetical protein
MRIQRNPGSPSAAVALSAMSPGRLPVNSVARRLTPDQRRAIGMRRPFRPALLDSHAPGWPGRGLPSPSRKGAGVWLLK